MKPSTLAEVLREVWHPVAMLPRSEEVVRAHDYLPRPRYLYITKAYVEGIGLEVGPVATPRNRGFVAFADGGCLPPPGLTGWVEGFQFEGWTYGREFHGAFRVIGIGLHKTDGPHAHYFVPIVLN